MSKRMTIAYTIGSRLYLNITNQCDNNCRFCIRRTGAIGYDLWLDREPALEEVLETVRDIERYEEVVFCGYGEPFSRPDIIRGVTDVLSGRVPLRLNTNGQSLLACTAEDVVAVLNGIDRVSVSLNAPDAESYVALCHPRHGARAYPAILDFIRLLRQSGINVMTTAVDWPGVDLDLCRKVAEELGVPFRVRPYQR